MQAIMWRLRAVQADCRGWSWLAILPWSWMTQWWGEIGFVVGFFAIPLLACLIHWRVFYDLDKQRELDRQPPLP